MRYWNKPEESKQLLAGLSSLLELMNCELFQLNEETEQDMLECGAIEMEVEEIKMCLSEAIEIIKDVEKNNKKGVL